ncbi:MAG: hypothetical protein GX352_00835 [Clostridiales bacterium]|nr:hypothetical protein [Clostridiales bacterium]
MKYHIDTIPVWDAYSAKLSCPLCYLYHKSEMEYVDFFLGGSVMEPATRIDINKSGFCGKHFQLLYEENNRLGLALITHSHLIETIKELKNLSNMLVPEQKKSLSWRFKRWLGEKFKKYPAPLSQMTNRLDTLHESCMICGRLESLLDRYAYTILHLWQNDDKFRIVLAASDGFCLHHFSLIMKMAKKALAPNKLDLWVNTIVPIQLKSLDKIEADLLWFTKKFDYRNQDKPWGDSRDALPRAIQRLSASPIEPPPISDKVN